MSWFSSPLRWPHERPKHDGDNCAKIYINLPFENYKFLDAPTDKHSTTVHSVHTVFMCFVFISQQTASCATYSIN